MVKYSRVLEIGYYAKEDVKGESLHSHSLFQTKNVSGQKSHSIKVEDLDNLRRNASRVGRVGIYVINFGENKEYMVLRKQDFDYYFGGEPDEQEEELKNVDGPEGNTTGTSTEES